MNIRDCIARLFPCLLLGFGFFALNDVSQTALAQSNDSVALPPGFIHEVLTDKLDGPTGFAISPDGRIFITQKAGTVRIYHNGALQPANFIDISYKVNQAADRGLLGVAVHPRFPAVRYVYLAFVYEPPKAKGHARTGARVARLLRVEADPANLNVALPGSEVLLLGTNSVFENIGNPDGMDKPPLSCTGPEGEPLWDCLPVEGTSHTLGTLAFGADGALYVGNGDGVSHGPGGERAQNLDSLAGKILRINPINGNGYATNPFFNGDLRSNRSKVYALGMRNPFRFSIHPFTGQLFVGDVGNSSWEEINRGGRGSNFGWPCYEGPNPAATFPICDRLFDGSWAVTQAIHAYPHHGGLGAAIAGDFYTGTAFPANYRNTLFFADFNARIIQYLTFHSDGNVSVNDFAANVPGPVQISMGADGNLYALYIITGSLARIRHVDGGAGGNLATSRPVSNTPPTVVLEAFPHSGRAPLLVNFSGENSFDADGDSLSYLWEFGDGNDSTEPNPSHAYITPGEYIATLRVTDARGGSRSNSIEISVGNDPPVAIIRTPESPPRYQIGDTISFSGIGIDTEDGELGSGAMVWDVLMHHNEHVHYDFFHAEGDSGSFVYEDHGDNTYLELCLTVTDSNGQQGKDCVDLLAQEVIYTFDSVPSGLPLLYEGTRYETPFKVQTYANATRRVGTPREPEEGLRFLLWSDWGAASHSIRIQDSAQTLTARFLGRPGQIERLERTQTRTVESAEIVNIAETGTEGNVENNPTPPPQPIPQTSSQSIPPAPVSPTASTTASVATGQILRQWWTGISGNAVSDLTEHPNYPHAPAGSEFILSFEAPNLFGNDYGTRIRGYLHPPTTGIYRFWIASDDSSQLWLSTDENPANAQRIAFVDEWTSVHQWDKYGGQASGLIMLEAGRRYYIEALHKEADQKDNLSVAWRIPGQEQTIIQGEYLSPFTGN